MHLLGKFAKNSKMNYVIGCMGLIAIALTTYNIYLAPAVDKIFAFTDLVMLLLLFGTFAAAVEKRKK